MLWETPKFMPIKKPVTCTSTHTTTDHYWKISLKAHEHFLRYGDDNTIYTIMNICIYNWHQNWQECTFKMNAPFKVKLKKKLGEFSFNIRYKFKLIWYNVLCPTYCHTIIWGHYVFWSVRPSVPYQVFGQGSLPWCSCCLNFKLGAYVHNGVNFIIITISQKVFMGFHWNFTVILSSRCKCTCDSGSVYYWGLV
jgi:hypothetical protein